MKVKKEYNYAEAPQFFAKCVATDCSAAKNCLRYQSAQATMNNESALWIVSPVKIAPQRGEACPFFRSLEPVTMARGFTNALKNMKVMNMKAVVEALIERYNRRTYYRLRRGEMLLDEKMQKEIAEIFIQHGAEQPVVFDAYEMQPSW